MEEFDQQVATAREGAEQGFDLAEGMGIDLPAFGRLPWPAPRRLGLFRHRVHSGATMRSCITRASSAGTRLREPDRGSTSLPGLPRQSILTRGRWTRGSSPRVTGKTWIDVIRQALEQPGDLAIRADID